MSSNYTTSRSLLTFLEILFYCSCVVFAVGGGALLMTGQVFPAILGLATALACLMPVAFIHIGRAVLDIADTLRGPADVSVAQSLNKSPMPASKTTAPVEAPAPADPLPTAEKVVFEIYKGAPIYAVSGQYEAHGTLYRNAAAARKAIDRKAS